MAIVVLALAAGGVGTHAAFTATTSNSGNSLATASTFTGCDYSAAILGTGGLVNYWRLGEASGTSAADSKGTSTGSYVGSPTLNQTGAIAGDSNKAARFNGTSSTVDVPDSAALRLNGSWSVEFWAKGVSFPASGWPGVFKKGDAATSSGWILFYDRVSGDFQYKRNNQTNGMPNMEIETGLYKHFVLAYDGTTLRGYENGTEVYSAAATWPSLAGAQVFQMGRADNFGNVDLDDVAVYNTAMSAGTAQSHFRCGQRYRDVVMDTPNLQSYWRMGETAGGVAFDTKSTYDGTYVGPPTLGQPGALTVAGDVAPDFDSLNDYMTVGDIYSYAGTANFTVETWINRNTLRETGYRWIVGKDTTVAPRDGWHLIIEANTQRPQFARWANGTSNVAAGTTATAAGTWYHLVGTYDGTSVRLYVNGVLESGAVASSVSMIDTTYPFRVGAIGGTGQGKFGGVIDEVAVYGRALSATEVKQHYDAR